MSSSPLENFFGCPATISPHYAQKSRHNRLCLVSISYQLHIFLIFAPRGAVTTPLGTSRLFRAVKNTKEVKHSSFSRLAGTEGIEPSRCRSQSPVPYLLAISLCSPTALQAATVAHRRTKSIVMLGYMKGRSSPCILYHKSRPLSRLMRCFLNHQPICTGIHAS